MKVPMALHHRIPWFTYDMVALRALQPLSYKRGGLSEQSREVVTRRVLKSNEGGFLNAND